MHLTKGEASQYIDDFLSGRGATWDWDDFISIPLDDPLLEEVRLKCASLPARFPPTGPGQYCSEAGMAELRGFLDALKAR